MSAPAGSPCILVIFGASGDLTKRLLMPALYNLACDGLYPQRSAIIGMAMDALFAGASPVFLQSLALMLKPDVYAPGDLIIRKGGPGDEMFFLARGEVEVIDGGGKVLSTLGQGSFFGEKALLTNETRTAGVRAKTQCDVYILDKTDFIRVLRDHPKIARIVIEFSKTHYNLDTTHLLDARLVRLIDHE